jgi:hypothetical protein
MLKLSCSFDFVRFILLKILTEWVINCYILCHFSISNTIVGAGAIGVGARSGAASRYSSYQMMWLLATPALQHCFRVTKVQPFLGSHFTI